MTLNPHSRPPESLRSLFKTWQKCSIEVIDHSPEILDFSRPETTSSDRLLKSSWLTKTALDDAFQKLLSRKSLDHCGHIDQRLIDCTRFEVKILPGLFIYPALLSSDVQLELLERLLHRDLSNAAHKTNLHLHYEVPYHALERDVVHDGRNASFFEAEPNTVLSPKDPSVHKPVTVRQVLEKKLRWVTLGGQYDWTAKVYPSEQPPDFPCDIGGFLRTLWPDVDAQAAIVNFYTPGDTLSVHRDVSEECDRGLISISIGCDGIFIIGNEDGSRHTTLRLRSGDAILMSGESRFAWHAVPRIIANTCPTALEDWPATGESTLANWNGWLSRKRINLNVRQMRTARHMDEQSIPNAAIIESR